MQDSIWSLIYTSLDICAILQKAQASSIAAPARQNSFWSRLWNSGSAAPLATVASESRSSAVTVELVRAPLKSMDGGFIANSLKLGSMAAQLATNLAVSFKEDAQQKMKEIEQEAEAKVSKIYWVTAGFPSGIQNARLPSKVQCDQYPSQPAQTCNSTGGYG